jgi:hypothetical protein
VLRPRSFREHDTHFLLEWDTASQIMSCSMDDLSHSDQMDYVCLRVPPHLRGTSWADLLSAHRTQLTDQLVVHSSPAKQILTKFEAPDFIHTYVDAASSTGGVCLTQGSPRDMLFELPRFGLEFELRAGLVWSLDYSGYTLHPCQQLLAEQCRSLGARSNSTAYTLPDFRQYLVMQRAQQQGVMAGQRGGKRVIVPVGQVQRRLLEVAVVHGHSSSDHLEVRQ